MTNLITIGNTSKLLRGLIRKCLTPREDRSRELLGKLSRDTMMIGFVAMIPATQSERISSSRASFSRGIGSIRYIPSEVVRLVE